MGMIVKALGLFLALAMLSMCVGMCGTSSKKSMPASVPAVDTKLEENCKDWIYNRNRAYKLGKEGDQAGAAKASLAMRSFMKDLEAQYPEKVITETIERLEKGGYRAGL